MTENTQLPVHTQEQQKYPRLQRYVNRGAVALTVASTGSLAMAAYDTTDIIANLGLAVSAAATIGVAWLGFTAGIAIWRNLRAAAK
jgi:hypothetical protein